MKPKRSIADRQWGAMNWVRSGSQRNHLLAVAAATVALAAAALGLISAVAGAKGSKGPSGTPILVGNIGPYTSTVLGPVERDLAATPAAWVAWTNAHGGIGGHPVKLIEKNDNFDPAQATTEVHELVADKVVAIVYDEDVGIEVAYAPYLQQVGVPVVGGQDYDRVWETNPDFFPTMATVSTKGYADVYAARYAHVRTLAESYCTESPACLQDVQAQKAAGPKLGVTVEIGPSASIVAPNYLAQCQVLAGYHAQGYYYSGSVAAIEKFATDCAQQGYKGTWVLPQPDNTQLSTPALRTFSVGQDLSLPYFAKLPQTKVFRQAMATYAPGVPLQINSLRIWGAFDVFKQAVESEKGRPVTPATIKAGLYKLHGFTDHGILPPLTFTRDQPTTVRCFFLWEIKDGAFRLPMGDHDQCAPPGLGSA